MKKLFKYLPLLVFGFLNAQEEVVHSVYFEFDKFALNEGQAKEVVDFIKRQIPRALNLFKFSAIQMTSVKKPITLNCRPSAPRPFRINLSKAVLKVKSSSRLKAKAAF